MEKKVYFGAVSEDASASDVQGISRGLLARLLEDEGIELSGEVSLKVHFGEKKNVTYIRPENYDGVIDLLEEKGVDTCFMETTVVYGGQRFRRDLHLKTAEEHGFTRLPVEIADGECGEDFVEVPIEGGKHFDSCKIARGIRESEQMLVLTHFKGHMLSGFGGAIKQLSMGCASKGGKLAMHMGIKPRIINRKCRKCHKCEPRCNEEAITISDDGRSFIDHQKCVGCGACVSICPFRAISLLSFVGILRVFGLGKFREKLVEYALAAQKDKKWIYLNFAMNITRGCDCEPRRMKPLIPDVGIFASTDPVAVDKACFDMVKERGRKFRGGNTFGYAERIGLGSANYTLVEVGQPPDSSKPGVE
jgi:uncharacterized Fe-S center protein